MIYEIVNAWLRLSSILKSPGCFPRFPRWLPVALERWRTPQASCCRNWTLHNRRPRNPQTMAAGDGDGWAPVDLESHRLENPNLFLSTDVFFCLCWVTTHSYRPLLSLAAAVLVGPLEELPRQLQGAGWGCDEAGLDEPNLRMVGNLKKGTFRKKEGFESFKASIFKGIC